MLFAYRKNLREHRVDDEGIVVVQMEFLPVAVPSVTFIPLFQELIHSVSKALQVALAFEFQQSGFDGGGEQQPVALVGLDAAGALEFFDDLFLSVGVKISPYLPGCSQKTLGKECGIDKRLSVPVFAESKVVLGFRVDGILQSLQGPFEHLGAQLPFFAAVRSQLQPWRDAADCPAYGFKIRHFPSVGVRGKGFERKVLLQSALGEILHYRSGNLHKSVGPRLALALRRRFGE